MTVRAGNLFVDVSAGSLGEEAFSEIFARPGLKIERIISQGQASPPGFWYDQAWNEWVIVLKGSATLQFRTS
jgi:cupin 2 domain-containing protein